ncbi:MAG: hypothetical protein Q4C22_01640, partial [Bacillota bacterium]|nr:hypothetical protein [Bacillota bacterium]
GLVFLEEKAIYILPSIPLEWKIRRSRAGKRKLSSWAKTRKAPSKAEKPRRGRARELMSKR